MKKTVFFISCAIFAKICVAQRHFSIATDFDIQHNMRKTQKYISLGPTFNAVFHFTAKNAAYVNFGFYSYGKFRNRLAAFAKDAATTPTFISFTNTSRVRSNHFSIGWRHYLKGSPAQKNDINVYTLAGLGLTSAQVRNSFTVLPDSNLYNLPVLPGDGSFKRLTLDLGAGVDLPLMADVFVYSEMRIYFPTSSYPSRYLLVNNDSPLTGLLCAGVRVLF